MTHAELQELVSPSPKRPVLAPNTGRLKLAATGAPHLSTIESIGTPSDLDFSDDVSATDSDNASTSGSLHAGDADGIKTLSYFQARTARLEQSTPIDSHQDSPTSEAAHVSLVSDPVYTNHTDCNSKNSCGTPPKKEYSTDFPARSRLRLDTSFDDIKHRFGGSQSRHQRREDAPSSADGDSESDNISIASSDGSELWGTPVDADAVAMGLVTVSPQSRFAAVAAYSRDQRQIHEIKRATSVSSMPNNFEGRTSETLSSRLYLKKKVSLPSIKISPSSTTASPAVTRSVPEANTKPSGILDAVGLSLETSADPLREIRSRCLSDPHLLLAKSIQRGCDHCQHGSALGLWVWAWTSELLCTACVQHAADKIPYSLKESLISRSLSLAIGDESSLDRIREVDTQMLARIANSLPADTLCHFDAVNQASTEVLRSDGSSSAGDYIPSGHSSALGLDLGGDLNSPGEVSGEISFIRVSSPRPSKPLRSTVIDAAAKSRPTRRVKGRVFRKALGRLTKLSVPKLHAMVTTSRSTTAAALLLPDVPVDALARLPPEQSVSRPDSNQMTDYDEDISADDSFLLCAASPLPTSPSIADRSPSVERSAALETRFLNISSIFVGTVSLRHCTDGSCDVLLDDVYVCTACQSTAQHYAGRLLLRSQASMHLAKVHPDLPQIGRRQYLTPFSVDWQSGNRSQRMKHRDSFAEREAFDTRSDQQTSRLRSYPTDPSAFPAFGRELDLASGVKQPHHRAQHHRSQTWFSTSGSMSSLPIAHSRVTSAAHSGVKSVKHARSYDGVSRLMKRDGKVRSLLDQGAVSSQSSIINDDVLPLIYDWSAMAVTSDTVDDTSADTSTTQPESPTLGTCLDDDDHPDLMGRSRMCEDSDETALRAEGATIDFLVRRIVACYGEDASMPLEVKDPFATHETSSDGLRAQASLAA